MQTLKLTIEVTYDLNGEKLETLKNMLQDAADYLAGNGMLSGYTSAEVEEWSATVSE